MPLQDAYSDYKGKSIFDLITDLNVGDLLHQAMCKFILVLFTFLPVTLEIEFVVVCNKKYFEQNNITFFLMTKSFLIILVTKDLKVNFRGH